MIDLNHRNPTSALVAAIDAAIVAEKGKESPRNYLGGSRLGHHCSRALQYEFFNAPKDEPFSGRLYRIFHRGHQGEEWMIDWLRAAGLDLRTQGQDGKQFGFAVAKGRIRGHCDGVIVGGPEHFGPYPRLWECKVLGEKGWKKLEKEKLRKAYPTYYGQVAIYQAYLQLDANPALFTALNANTMDIYAEDVPFDGDEAQRLSDRGVQILQACDAGELLPRISEDPSWYECKFCDHARRCHYENS